ncbi:MAG: hypothetical protein EI684_16470 [Candidatus Viridilinea halotolerans]|uniref:DNA helicase DnaB-like N-terminal domain-containing protein n=1 Tax=Candidatus Viridilinea halotolerans TaxID=2491704 RepID=A0A426TVC1_9CHLR|nr:MAG: hypothetical protein EI684_16470 [Candidatus Viridilinea halotolerans]
MDFQLPMDLTAERCTLGALLLEREAIIVLAAWLRPEHFYLERYALIYEAVLACYHRREPPDLTTVSAELRRQGRLDLVGGVSALSEMITEVPTAVHVEYYARVVERTFVGRALVVDLWIVDYLQLARSSHCPAFCPANHTSHRAVMWCTKGKNAYETCNARRSPCPNCPPIRSPCSYSSRYCC